MRKAVLQVTTRLGIDYDNEYSIYLFGNYQRRRICCLWFGQMESEKCEVAYSRSDIDTVCGDWWRVGCVCRHENIPP